MKLLILFSLYCLCTMGDNDTESKLDKIIIACHTTDFECFRRQFKSIRDQMLAGNKILGITPYEHYVFRYGDTGTCIKLSGLEQSELTNIRMDSSTKEFTWTLELPFKVQQVENTTQCADPETEFEDAARNMTGPLRKFTGNSTIQIVYPYELRKKKGVTHMILGDENLDVVLDIPDLSQYNNDSLFERNLYELSEWAYSVVQYVDAAQHFALPFTSRFRTIAEIVPLHSMLLLYPEEKYTTLQFKQSNAVPKCYE